MYTKKDIQNYCMKPQTYSKAVSLYNCGSVQNLQVDDFEEEACITIEGDVEGSYGNEYHVRLEYNLANHEFEDYECECPAYSSYPGMCKHCGAVALEYLDCWKYPEEDASIASEHLDQIEKTAQPHRRITTDNRILNLVKSYVIRNRMQKLKADGNIEVVPELSEAGWSYYYGSHHFQLTFKIGSVDGRKYVLKNLTEFASIVQNEELHSYGKQLSFVHTKNMFTEESWNYVLLILTGVRLQEQRFQTLAKELPITATVMDVFFTLNLNREITCTTHLGKEKKLQILDQNPPMKLQIHKKDGGFQVKIPPVTLLSGEAYLYINIGSCIYRCTGEYRQSLEDILKCASPDRETILDIADSDMTAFCASILPVLEQHNALDKGEISLEDYQPKKAEISYYLDEEDGHITMKPVCSYGDISYNLLEAPELSSEYHDRTRELQALNLAKAYFPSEDEKKRLLYFNVSEDDRMYQLLDTGIRQLEEEGAVYTTDRIRSRNVIRSPKSRIGISLHGGLLELSLSSDAFSVKELADILNSYRKKKKYYRLKNGDFLNLENNSVADVAELLDGLALSEKELEHDIITIPKFRACYVDQTLRQRSGQLQVERNSDYKAIIRNMKNVEDSDYPIPEELSDTLREYQKNGYRWLRTLADLGFGGILADDMGLGKTLQTITYLLSRKEEGRCSHPNLIICPASLVYNWKREFAHFAPEISVLTIVGTALEREELIRNGLQHDVWITSYDIIKRDISLYRDLLFDTEIIDEAQNIKNQGTMAAKAVKKISADVRFALTGTPIENRLSELWSIFDYLMPGLLGTYEKFRKGYELPIVQKQNDVLMERLKRMVSPFILRRLKQDVLKELPDKLEQVVYTRMEEEQRKLYIGHAQRLIESLSVKSSEDIQKGKLQILSELTRFRQLCCDPGLIYEDYHSGACKIETCLELVKEAIAGKHKILIFSQFTSIFPVLEERLKLSKIPYYELTGKTSKEERQRLTESFNSDETPVFLISLKAGGTGLNLTAASIVIHFDPWWNLAAQNQATDRAHRIGQQNQVVVFKLIAQDTIEEKIIQLQEKKQAMAGQLLEGEGISASSLTKDDFIEILKF